MKASKANCGIVEEKVPQTVCRMCNYCALGGIPGGEADEGVILMTIGGTWTWGEKAVHSAWPWLFFHRRGLLYCISELSDPCYCNVAAQARLSTSGSILGVYWKHSFSGDRTWARD